MESDTEATTRSSTTVRRSEPPPPSTRSGRMAATQPAVAHSGRTTPPDQTRTAAQRGVGGGHDLADEHADRRAGRPEAGQHQHEHGDHPYAHLDQEVHREGLVRAVGLEEAAVEREEDEEGGRGEDGRDADAALLVEQRRRRRAGWRRRGRPTPARACCPAGACGPPTGGPGGRCRPRATSSPVRTTATTTADPGMERMR